MKTAVIIDTACDLPAAYIQQRQLHLLPSRLLLGEQTLTDQRDTNLTEAFHHRCSLARHLEARVDPCSASTIARLFLERLVVEYDRAVLITISQTHSLLFQNATEASFAVLRGYRERRQQMELNTPFYLSVLDSKTVFAGQAVLVHEVVRLLDQQELSFNELRRFSEDFRRHIRCYLLLDNLSHVRYRRDGKDDPHYGFLDYRPNTLLGLKSVIRFVEGETALAFKALGFERALSALFEQAALDIDQGLRSPLVVLSYAGDVDVLRRKPAFLAFERHVQQWGIEIMVTLMSATGGMYAGPGAVSLAFAVA